MADKVIRDLGEGDGCGACRTGNGGGMSRFGSKVMKKYQRMADGLFCERTL